MSKEQKEAVKRELELHNNIIKLAEVSQVVIETTQKDRTEAAANVDRILELGKKAGLFQDSSIPQIKKALGTHAGTANIVNQILDEVVRVSEQGKTASADKPSATGFVVDRHPRSQQKAAAYGGDDSDDVISSMARHYR